MGRMTMKDIKTKPISMTYKALLSYVLNTNYRSVTGVMGLLISLVSLGVMVGLWGRLTVRQRVVFLILGLIFTVINPLLLAFQAFKQFKLSPSYKHPIVYTFTEKGIGVTQQEQTLFLKWEQITRLMLTNAMFAIYTSRVHAFVLPLRALEADKSKIIARTVQFAEPHSPRMSGSLGSYRVHQ